FEGLLPRIAYYGHARRILKYAAHNGTNWVIEIVDAFGDVGKQCSLAMQGTTPVIAYIDAGNSKGVFTFKPGTTWERRDFGWNGAASPDLYIVAGLNYSFISFSSPWDQGEVRLQIMDNVFNQITDFPIFTADFLDQYGGDGRSAYNALFSQVNGFDLALYGNHGGTPPEYDSLILVDSDNSRVRVINLNDPNVSTPITITVANTQVAPGNVDTVLGNGDFTYDPADDGALVDNGTSPVEVAMPQDVTVDSNGNIYVADSVSQRIRALNLGSTTMTCCGISIAPGAIDTIAGGDSNVSVTASTFYPSGLDVDPTNGDVYVTDYIGAVFRIDPTARTSTVVAGFGAFGFAGDGGPATQAEFWAPHDVAVDSAQNIYILDRGNMRVRAVNLYNGTGYSIAGVTIDQGNIDTVLGTGVITGSVDGPGGDPSDDLGDAGPASSATVTEVGGIVVDRRNPLPGPPSSANAIGVLIFSDGQNRRVRAINLNTNPVTICGVTIAPGNVDTIMGSGVRFHDLDGPGGNPADEFFPGSLPLLVPISRAGAISMDPGGILFIFDREQRVGYALNTNTSPVDVTSTMVAAGTVERVVGDYFRDREFNGDGIPAVLAQFDETEFMTAWRDSSGTVQEIYISERRHQRIRLVDENGVIGTWVGTGNAGFNGDGVPPSNVLVNEPGDIAVYESGGRRYIYYVDSRNRRVRREVR
ncbi:MAG: NHL repeat-containing protein, partial [Planctomycetota bacterium]